jgi:hypothetical protein
LTHGLHQINHSDIPFKVNAIDDCGIDRGFLYLADALKAIPLLVLEMDFTVILLMTTSGFLGTVIAPTQIGVMTLLADQMQVQLTYPVDKLGFTVVTIGQYITNAGRPG